MQILSEQHTSKQVEESEDKRDKSVINYSMLNYLELQSSTCDVTTAHVGIPRFIQKK